MRPFAGGIRQADPGDFPALARLWHAAWHDGHRDCVPPALLDHRGLDHFEAELARVGRDCHLWDGLHGPEGFVSVSDGWILRLFVAQAARGGGVAGRLLAHGEDLLRAEGVRTGKVDVLSGNARAHRFYLRHGWRESRVAIIEAATPDGPIRLNTHILTKDLLPA